MKLPVREMAVLSDRYDMSLSLLIPSTRQEWNIMTPRTKT